MHITMLFVFFFAKTLVFLERPPAILWIELGNCKIDDFLLSGDPHFEPAEIWEIGS